MADKVYFNLRGKLYTVLRHNLSYEFPESRICKLLKKQNANQNEFYFDRNSSLFEYILDAHRHGILHVPSSLCFGFVREELEFWGLPIWCISRCCLKNYSQYLDELRIIKEIGKSFNDDNAHTEETEIYTDSLCPGTFPGGSDVSGGGKGFVMDEGNCDKQQCNLEYDEGNYTKLQAQGSNDNFVNHKSRSVNKSENIPDVTKAEINTTVKAVENVLVHSHSANTDFTTRNKGKGNDGNKSDINGRPHGKNRGDGMIKQPGKWNSKIYVFLEDPLSSRMAFVSILYVTSLQKKSKNVDF